MHTNAVVGQLQRSKSILLHGRPSVIKSDLVLITNRNGSKIGQPIVCWPIIIWYAKGWALTMSLVLCNLGGSAGPRRANSTSSEQQQQQQHQHQHQQNASNATAAPSNRSTTSGSDRMHTSSSSSALNRVSSAAAAAAGLHTSPSASTLNRAAAVVTSTVTMTTGNDNNNNTNAKYNYNENDDSNQVTIYRYNKIERKIFTARHSFPSSFFFHSF